MPMVPSSEGFKVLGTLFTLQGRTSAEIRSRISASWAKICYLWPVLGKRDGNLAKRLRLFNACVTQTALGCNESWLLTQNKLRMLQSTQTNMLRETAGPRRRPEETWVEWTQRSTRTARSLAQQAGVRMWLETHLQSWSSRRAPPNLQLLNPGGQTKDMRMAKAYHGVMVSAMRPPLACVD